MGKKISLNAHKAYIKKKELEEKKDVSGAILFLF